MPDIGIPASAGLWIVFAVIVLGVLALDLGVLHRDAHQTSRREALGWVGAWVSLALLFNAFVYWRDGVEIGLQWTTGYLIEQSLSIDNVFVILLIIQTFRVPPQYQHRVLFWGVLGAVVMRGVLIVVGAALIDRFQWIMYVFGALLLYTAFKFIRESDAHPDLSQSPILKFASRFMPATHEYHGQSFFHRINGVRHMTPLFLVLLLIEGTDLMFAVDSIPAIYAITTDPFIVFTSNVFAILGLRSMFFVLSGYVGGLVYLKPALAMILAFVGVKMILIDVIHVHPLISLGVIASILVVAIVASLQKAKQLAAAEDPHVSV